MFYLNKLLTVGGSVMPSRNELFKQRTAAQSDLRQLVAKCEGLEAEYKEVKGGQAGLLNLYGLLASNIPNQGRLNLIQEVQSCVEAVKHSLNIRGLSFESGTKNPNNDELAKDIKHYQAATQQLQGAVLAKSQEIYNSYVVRSPEKRSELYDSLRAIFDQEQMSPEARQDAVKAYKDLMENTPSVASGLSLAIAK